LPARDSTAHGPAQHTGFLEIIIPSRTYKTAPEASNQTENRRIDTSGRIRTFVDEPQEKSATESRRLMFVYRPVGSGSPENRATVATRDQRTVK
jgi:hypothetical protein